MLPEYLTEKQLTGFIGQALAEDEGNGDHASLAVIPEHEIKKAKIISKSAGTLSGVYLARKIFKHIDPQCELITHKNDGDTSGEKESILSIRGKARKILTGERLVLNCMQRMSGIATYTSQLKNIIAHTHARLLDTRKTTPNFRMMEKWAVKTGGGENHRSGLFDMIILKDNHIDYAGGIAKAIDDTHRYLQNNNLNLQIEVETRNLEEVETALDKGGIDRILLDNMEYEMLSDAVKMIGGSIPTEASGNINEHTIKKVAETGVDYISVGALTHSYKCMDLSLKAD